MHKPTQQFNNFTTDRKSPQVLIIDGGYHDEKIGICEIGDALTSNFLGYNQKLQVNNNHHMESLILAELGKKYNRVVILNPTKVNYLFGPAIEECNKREPNKYFQMRLPSYDKSIVLNIDQKKLEENAQIYFEHIEQNLQKIGGLKGKTWCFIVNPENGEAKGANLLFAQKLQKIFAKNYPNETVAIVNSASLTFPITNNKFLFMYFQDPKKIASHCFNLFTSDNSKIQDLSHQYQRPVVLKPLSFCGGLGVNVIPMKNFENEINFLKELARYRTDNDFDYPIGIPYSLLKIFEKYNINLDYWLDKRYSHWFLRRNDIDPSPLAIIQPHYPSKFIRNHYATFRIVCVIYPDNTMTLIDGYWKLALEANADNEISTRNTVSVTEFDQNVNFDPIENMTSEDKNHIFKRVEDEILTIYQNNPEGTLESSLTNLLNHSNPLLREFVAYDSKNYLPENHLTQNKNIQDIKMHQDRISAEILVKKSVSKGCRALYDNAIKCYKSGDIPAAIKLFDKAFEGYPTDLGRANCKAALASCYRDLKKYPEAIECCEKAKSLYLSAGLQVTHADMIKLIKKMDGIQAIQHEDYKALQL